MLQIIKIFAYIAFLYISVYSKNIFYTVFFLKSYGKFNIFIDSIFFWCRYTYKLLYIKKITTDEGNSGL